MENFQTFQLCVDNGEVVSLSDFIHANVFIEEQITPNQLSSVLQLQLGQVVHVGLVEVKRMR